MGTIRRVKGLKETVLEDCSSSMEDGDNKESQGTEEDCSRRLFILYGGRDNKESQGTEGDCSRRLFILYGGGDNKESQGTEGDCSRRLFILYGGWGQ